MPILDVVFIGLSIIWILEFLFFKSRRGKSDKEDTGSFPWIMLSVIVIVITSLVSRELQFLLLPYAGISMTGLFIFAAGIFLRYWGIKELGKQFTRGVQVRKNDTLVSSGPFRILRHPLYTGLLFIVLGFSLYTSSLAGVFFTAVLFLPLLLRRISIEEEMLKEGFGEKYESWLATRYRLLPFIY
ncbi:methyltransferase family protein [Alkalicoccus daliensis]|uniref:Protein-S-isoprenylcysteine O-methyltransferase Ste14 n=1 Tax=Alkalicoccus daliensis TaxID=745820 RepID=A0A1H0J9D4_9BACI|nr:isoprenylcysteine carboxylmethyltransferase family protein [Alkalicoccus daliensis]SDO40326.1 Protein-S-isoprenylcysteine O-methyltransferase Ste14 [Alkalicoccus daliensis]